MESVTPSGQFDSVSHDEDLTLTQAVLQERRDGLAERLRNGASGSEVVAGFTDLVDSVLIARYQNVLRQHVNDSAVGMQQCCLVAVGGYGRRELSPYSDIDVMVLYHSGGETVVKTLSEQVLHHLWDLGFQVGHSVRSIQDCLVLAEEDLAVKTALMESRFLAGGASVYQEFQRRYARRVLGRRVDQFIREKVEERKREYAKFGETIYLLEPNIKKTKGGLRDLHLLQWVGMAKYQAPTLQDLANRGILAHPDYLALVEAREFLWKVRALLHVEAGRAQEILSFEEQVRLAKAFGFHDQPHLLAVEQFMQLYYRHTTGIYDRCVRFLDRAQEQPLWARVKGWWPQPLIHGYFSVSGTALSVPQDKLLDVLHDPGRLLDLFKVSQAKGLTIDGSVLEEIHRQMETVSDEVFQTPSVREAFREILSGPRLVGETLTLMHQARVLEKLVPAFGRVRGLMQFNQYHKYTVDEHSLLTVRLLERLGRQDGIFHDVYEKVHRKDILHLAALLHDIGKGLPEDHSEVGKGIARDMAVRLQFDQQEARTLEFLVHQHLLMANTAFRRDPYDDKVLLKFSRAVGTPALLRKLLMLTAADIAAVGPETLTKWKESLLLELYTRTLPEVSGGSESLDTTQDIKKVATEVCGLWESQDLTCQTIEATSLPDSRKSWVEEQLGKFPQRYLSGTPRHRMVAHLQALDQILTKSPLVESAYIDDLRVCEYTLIARDHLKPGIVMNVTGVLAAFGLHVLDAQIMTRSDGIVFDSFFVHDPDFDGPPTAVKRQKVEQAIIKVMCGEDTLEQLMQRSHRLSFDRPFPVSPKPAEVQIDNETSDQFTIIDVFADDRQGLLSVIARTVFELGLSIHGARIATKLDQVVDVFYVTGADGEKINDEEAREKIRETLRQAVDTFLQ
ncbi:[protein-PII] uridylyltransferase [Candidatus Nitronereus thalassa]|uniref:Bifunctional uridylyltransferase/uridylyl-removing enzyme n=1 Tax=Candidatus Nitronereus thalassa TaxID=3020898 RepID=A0ABU3KBY9_9BACT|nr:[protein-PII] uridylyltransferase [Candidatus Nitronereus thalassa]MDT7043813.1 [protein-PII] uridylyltransferase [Candidatus Nitronereus thalassa]